MTNIKIVFTSAVVAIIVVLMSLPFIPKSSVSSQVNPPVGTIGSGYTNLTNLSLSGILEFMGNAGYTGIQEDGSVNTCGTATSTMFNIANPITAATSTAEITIFAVGQATSTNITVGTTTSIGSVLSTNVSPALVNAATVATTSGAYIIGGLATNLGNGQVSAGAATSMRVVVGPGERLAGFATTTAVGSGAANYTPGFTSCIYKVKWRL